MLRYLNNLPQGIFFPSQALQKGAPGSFKILDPKPKLVKKLVPPGSLGCQSAAPLYGDYTNIVNMEMCLL